MMRKKLQLVATLCLLAVSLNGFSQTGRYLTEVFTSVTVTSNVVYGNNLSVLTGTPAPSDLKMDVYQPTGDVLTARPLVIVLHTGSFLPAVANGQATGSKTDSAVVEMCNRFAKRGYVAVAADYRLGWNALSTNTDVRTGTLLNAVYRAIQDAKNCVRYFKEDKATANTYKIDTTKIAVGGLGSGGYIALAYASLNQVAEIQLGKFLDNTVSPPVPYIDQSLSGNFDGTNTTGLNIANLPSHTSTINMAFNVGGAIGDTSWINAGEVPIVGLHCYKDANAPYTTGAVIVPTTGAFVVEASGSYDVIRVVNKPSIDNNAIFNSSIYTDVYTTRANTINDGLEGLYPFVTPVPVAATCTGTDTESEQGSPWDWWSEATFIAQYNGYSGTTNGPIVNCKQKLSNPDMSAAKGRLYMDTIQGYLNPRMVCALGLAGCVPNPAGVNENVNVSDITIFPNPSSTEINFSVKGSTTIKSVELYDVTGRMVKQIVGLNTQKYTIQREGLSTGLYITKIQLNKGSISKKIIL
ncbi:MAG: T9SS type A sorting domain-containing protein, partial [Bacteroidota bacterium]